MSEKSHNDFGGIDQEVEGRVETRKLQTGGRLNLPDKFLQYIDVPVGSKVMIVAEDGELKVKKADSKHLAVAAIFKGLAIYLEAERDGE